MATKLIAEEQGIELKFDEGDEWVIGRDPEACQLVIEDPSASRVHLVARRSEQGIEVENLSETNPITINQQPVEDSGVLQAGDTVQIGDVVFVYVDEEEAPEAVEDTTQPPEAEEEAAAQEAAEEESPAEEQAESEQEEEEPRQDTILDVEDEDEQVFEEINLDIASGGRWLLKVVAGPNNGAEFQMEAGQSYVLGTDAAACDVIFHDMSVSRQHAKLTVSEDGEVTIEDLGSRNGVRIDEDTVEGVQTLGANHVVSLGTTAFMVIDREEGRVTIIPPPLATFGKVVQEETMDAAHAAVSAVQQEVLEEQRHQRDIQSKGTLVVLAIITGLFVIMGLGISTLFNTTDVAIEEVDHNSAIQQALAEFPSVRFSFSPSTKQLLLLGHVLTNTDRSQILYNLRDLKFIGKIDDNIVIDELVWQETNKVLVKNPNWRAVSIQAPAPGQFVLTGYLRQRNEADKLSEYISLNFPYPELLSNRVTVEEDVLAQIGVMLQENGMREVQTEMSNGEVTFNGFISFGKGAAMDNIVEEVRQIPGVRVVKNFVAEQQPEALMVDLTGQYEVTGTSATGKNISVVINGQILTPGETLDGMKITKIDQKAIHLERDGFKYKIEYNK